MAVQASPLDDEVGDAAWSQPERLVVESCTITRWRGYVSSTFVALLADGTPLAESAAFRWRGTDAPADEGRARMAYDGLRDELARLGWEDTGARREVWYAGRFTRLVAFQDASPSASAPPTFEAPMVVEPTRLPLHKAPVPPPAPPVVGSVLEPEPRSVEAAVEAPPRRSRAVTVVSVLGIIVALAVGAYLAFGQAGHKVARAQAAPTPVAVAVAKPKHAAPAVPATADPTPAGSAPAKTPAPASVRLAISTNGRSSWLELRRGSATGTVLFTGELAPGRTLHVSGKRVWGRFGAAGNLTITANGKPVGLLGTYEHLFVAAKR